MSLAQFGVVAHLDEDKVPDLGLPRASLLVSPRAIMTFLQYFLPKVVMRRNITTFTLCDD